MIQLSPTPEDYQVLLNTNPLAAEQLKSIVLARLLASKDEELTALKEENDNSSNNKKNISLSEVGAD